MRKIYYLTRSYLPVSTGGTLIRAAQVKYLKTIFDVKVVTPNYDTNVIEYAENILRIPFPFSKIPLNLYLIFEKFGIFDDYLDTWVQTAFKYLYRNITSSDIIFATSGGELGMIKLGSLLRSRLGCKLIVNFHDPLDYGLINGKMVDNKFHVNRDRLLHYFLKDVNFIITSSKFYCEVLRSKYPDLLNRISYNYFGYIEEKKGISIKNQKNVLNVVYGGAFSYVQSPEILAEAATGLENINVFYIGNYNSYPPVLKYIDHPSIKFIPYLDREQYIQFICNEINVGFLSLKGNYFGACVPSKLFEYINLGLPILGVLPKGDAMDLINKKGYGIACDLNINELREKIMLFWDNAKYSSFKINILKDHNEWSMAEKMNETIQIVNQIAN